eukprot:TRINITY_DN14335_c0_g1_i2.p1 TRINITY_DN14335_c0_g1~~TRINITY_DN14335_c0_g1_i2.p1  ORF type:complete len:287 (+),score=25.16 TRINITY_DN14335_c0_g1_i2:47-907(+)
MVSRGLRSTAELYRVRHRNFYGKYAGFRRVLDYTYHNNYSRDRQALQDRVIDALIGRHVQLLEDNRPSPHPWLVFSAGAMGAGKTRTLEWMSDAQHFPLDKFIFLDHDVVKFALPEMYLFQKVNPVEAASLLQKEAGYIIEIATNICMSLGVNCLVDGSLRDKEWYSSYINAVRRDFSSQRIGIIHVHADETDVVQRAKERSMTTGRIVPEETLRTAIKQVPKSVSHLQSHVDTVLRIDNSGALPPRLDYISSDGITLKSPPWKIVSSIFETQHLTFPSSRQLLSC